MSHHRCHTTDVTPHMSHHRCHTTDVTPQMSHHRCHTTDVIPQMSHHRCHTTDVIQQMSYNICHTTDVTPHLALCHHQWNGSILRTCINTNKTSRRRRVDSHLPAQQLAVDGDQAGPDPVDDKDPSKLWTSIIGTNIVQCGR